MKIEYKKVTWYSQILAIVIGIGIFFIGFYLGTQQMSPASTSISNLFSTHKPISFYRPYEFLPATSTEGIITSQSELDQLYSDTYEADYGEYGSRWGKPEIDFEQFFILYQKMSGTGCSVEVTPALLKSGENSLVYDTQIYEEGTCEIGLVGTDWIVIPRTYLNYEIEFKSTVIHSDLR
jgi:hypothetical protein